MPELPEVETIKRDLEKQVTGKTISRIEINLPRIARRQRDQDEIAVKTKERAIKKVGRRGKFLLFYLDSSDILIFHLGMTGQLLFCPNNCPFEIDKYTHVVIHLKDNGKILFRDPRQFGQVFVINQDKLEEKLDLGPEPLSAGFTEEILRSILNRPTKIKPLLLDQKKIAGIGNIYADEILFEASLHPLKSANSLTENELSRLFLAIKNILSEGVKQRGTSISDYVDASGEKGNMQNKHRVYRRTKEPCPLCGTGIEKIVIGGRSTHFCPCCQKPNLQ